jgi:hypothetical protein
VIAPPPPSIAGLLATMKTAGKLMLYWPDEIGQRCDEIALPILVLSDNISGAAW